MDEETTRRSLLKSAAGVAAAMGLVGTAAGHEGPIPHPPDEVASAAQDAPYTVATVEKSEFTPEVLVIPAGATVTFIGNRYPHTVTSTDSLATVLEGCGDGSKPYDGDDDPAGGGDGTKGDDGVVRHTVTSPEEAYSVFFSSAEIAEITYETAGQYPYYCEPHCGSLMMGEIIVESI
jgi:plastocyanin